MNEEQKKRAKEAFDHLENELEKEKDIKLTGNVAEDFPELVDDDDDIFIGLKEDGSTVVQTNDVLTQEKINEYLKRSTINEVVDNIELKKNSIYDKRLKRPWYRKFLDALFLEE